MLKVDPKTANMATLQIFYAGFGISDPKLIKFDWFQTKYILAVDQLSPN